jgi:hypothetical protein
MAGKKKIIMKNPYRCNGAIYVRPTGFLLECANCGTKAQTEMSIICFNKIHILCTYCGHSEKI